VLPSRSELERRNPPQAALDPRVVELSTEWKIEAAKTMERVGRAFDKRIQKFESVGAANYASLVAFASSEGISDAAQASYVMLYSAPVGELEGQLQVGSWSDQKRFLEDLKTPEEVGRIAAERAVRMLGAKQGPTAKLPVVFEPSIAASFFGGILAAIDGNLVLKGASFLRDKLGAAIAPDWLSIDDDALYPRGLGNATFDGEGLATRKQSLIEKGVLKTFLYDSLTAHKAKAQSTHTASRGYRGLPGIGTTTVVARAGKTVPHEELLKGIRRGLYVTSMLGRGADAVTGDYSRGANGLLIEDGELGKPVQEITVAGNLLDMLASLEAAGDDLEFHGALGASSLRFKELSIAGG
jgi:PmbA protein